MVTTDEKRVKGVQRSFHPGPLVRQDFWRYNFNSESAQLTSQTQELGHFVTEAEMRCVQRDCGTDVDRLRWFPYTSV